MSRFIGSASFGHTARTLVKFSSCVRHEGVNAREADKRWERGSVGAAEQVRFSWSEPVNGFAAGAVALGGVGGTLSHWRTLVPGSVFTATVTPATNGRVTLSVPAAAARDDRGKANTASSNVLTATYDGTRPMVTITGPASKQSAPFEVLFLWSEPVMGFNPKSVRAPSQRCACRL